MQISITLYVFGNRHRPRPPRANKDIGLVGDRVHPTQPPTGASMFANLNHAPLTGHYYKLRNGTELPEGLAIIADGRDIGGPHAPTHHTLYPSREMQFEEFVEKFFQCDWVYVGKKTLDYGES